MGWTKLSCATRRVISESNSNVTATIVCPLSQNDIHYDHTSLGLLLKIFITLIAAKSIVRRNNVFTTWVRSINIFNIVNFPLAPYNSVDVKFGVVAAVTVKIAVFLGVALCSLLEMYRRFRGSFCLHYLGRRTVLILTGDISKLVNKITEHYISLLLLPPYFL
jgi:hypothetical protein